MADKYLFRDAATGVVTQREATVVGGSPTQAGDVVALGADGRLSETLLPVGIGADTQSSVAGESLAAGDFVYINGSGQVFRASAATTGTEAIGFVLQSYVNGANALVYFEGRNTALTGLTVGARYYLSDSVPGGIMVTPLADTVGNAGKKHQFLGRAVSATSISFEGDDVIIL